MIRSIVASIAFIAAGQFSASAQVATTTRIATSGSPSFSGTLVTFTATVAPAVPDGETVNFYDGTTQLGITTTTSSF